MLLEKAQWSLECLYPKLQLYIQYIVDTTYLCQLDLRWPHDEPSSSEFLEVDNDNSDLIARRRPS